MKACVIIFFIPYRQSSKLLTSVLSWTSWLSPKQKKKQALQTSLSCLLYLHITHFYYVDQGELFFLWNSKYTWGKTKMHVSVWGSHGNPKESGKTEEAARKIETFLQVEMKWNHARQSVLLLSWWVLWLESPFPPSGECILTRGRVTQYKRM